uniref:COMM domain-containing protein 8 isoform X2 n=1 Tax=Doryrhamphus excisus TaxID=161450 RepID=UPI0025ADDED5|nr:COMM domain-containing protein 8 isoform X2 [Doryrhamphus excisus]
MVIKLARLPATECLQLCHRVVDGLCGQEPPRRGDYAATWSLEEWQDLLNSLSAVFRRAVGNNSSDEEVLAALPEMSRSHSEAVLHVLKARKEDIRHALLDGTNSITSATLQDFDWQLKTPLLSLSLDIRENGTFKPITVETNKEELTTLISSLEAANKVVLQLTNTENIVEH